MEKKFLRVPDSPGEEKTVTILFFILVYDHCNISTFYLIFVKTHRHDFAQT